MKRKIKKNIKNAEKLKTELKPNEFGVILEEISSNMKLLLEGHSDLSKRIYILDNKVDRNYQEMNSRFDEADKKFNGIDSNFKTVFEYLSKIDDELQSIKSEIAELKISVQEKAEKNQLLTLEKRVEKLEENFLHYCNLAKAT